MKKQTLVLIATLVLGSQAFADGIYGTIVEVNDASKSIVLQGANGQNMNVKILPHTEIDMDDCGLFGMDKYGKFADLKIGTFIEVELFGMGENLSAKEIKIECKKRAY